MLSLFVLKEIGERFILFVW